jgi:hypothetical protein
MSLRKLQAPSSKLQRNIKFQTPIVTGGHRKPFRSLRFGAALVLGAWDLELRPQLHKRNYA